MLGLILAIAVFGLLVWAIITYIPMPQPFQGIIIIIAILVLVAMVFGGGGFNFGSIGCGGTGRLFH